VVTDIKDDRRSAPTGALHASQLTKTDLVHARLRDDIVVGRYQPGMPISERALAEENAVSRVPVREALIRLARDGLVDLWPGRGAAVKVFTSETMVSLYEAREALEGMAARLSAERMPPAALRAVCDRMRAEIASPTPDFSDLTLLGHDFHEGVMRGSRNSALIELASAISDQVEICRRLSYRAADESESMQAAEEHLGIAEAIENQSAADAERLMREHIATWAAVLRRHMAGDHSPI
jgi:DNA-binding GntR family transcriptional regulator